MGWAMVSMKRVMHGGKKKQKYNPATSNPLQPFLTSVVAQGRISNTGKYLPNWYKRPSWSQSHMNEHTLAPPAL